MDKVFITFRHSRDVFVGNGIKKYLKDMFPTIRFSCCEYGNHYPSFAVDKADWEVHKKRIKKLKNYIKNE